MHLVNNGTVRVLSIVNLLSAKTRFIKFINPLCSLIALLHHTDLSHIIDPVGAVSMYVE